MSTVIYNDWRINDYLTVLILSLLVIKGYTEITLRK